MNLIKINQTFFKYLFRFIAGYNMIDLDNAVVVMFLNRPIRLDPLLRSTNVFKPRKFFASKINKASVIVQIPGLCIFIRPKNA